MPFEKVYEVIYIYASCIFIPSNNMSGMYNFCKY